MTEKKRRRKNNPFEKGVIEPKPGTSKRPETPQPKSKKKLEMK